VVCAATLVAGQGRSLASGPLNGLFKGFYDLGIRSIRALITWWELLQVQLAWRDRSVLLG